MERCYWDSDCFLGFLQEEQDKQEECCRVLQEAESQKVQIVTSALTIAEVLAIKHRQPIPVEMRQKVEAFFRQPYIVTVSLTRRDAERARSIVWDHGIDPKDACHVAAALRHSVPVLHTFDRKLLEKSQLVGAPSLIIERPSVKEPRMM